MFSRIDSASHQELSRISLDPIDTFPKELLSNPVEVISKIFSYLDLAAFAVGCQVSKKWQLAAIYEGRTRIYREIAFGNEKWRQTFGKDAVKDEDDGEEFSSLPSNIVKILNSPCPAFPEKKVLETHMLVRIPKTIDGESLTLKCLGKFAQEYFSPDTYENYLWPFTLGEQDAPIDKSRWVLMTKGLLPESKRKSYAEQQTLIADLAKKAQASYEVPKVLEAAVCIFLRHFGSGISKDETYVYTRCQEKGKEGHQMMVSAIPNGLDIFTTGELCDNICIVALRKF
jgi:hypothetical protein